MTTEQVANNREKALVSIDALRKAVESGVVWNAEFEDLKSRLGGSVWRDTEALIWPAMRDGVDEAFKYPVSPSSVHDVRSFSKKIEAGRAKGLAVAGTVENFLAFWTPVVTLFDQAKPLIKKGRRPAENVDDSERRTLENTGTCPVCGKNVKLEGGRLVHHGYTVQYQAFQGGCFGVGHEAWEVSPKGAQDYASGLEVYLVDITEEYDSWKAEGIDKVFSERTKKYLVKVDQGYQEAVDRLLRDREYQIKNLTSTLEWFREKIANWTPSTLPGILAGFDR